MPFTNTSTGHKKIPKLLTYSFLSERQERVVLTFLKHLLLHRLFLRLFSSFCSACSGRFLRPWKRAIGNCSQLSWMFSAASTQQDNSQYITTLLLNWTFSAASTQQDNSQYITTLLLNWTFSTASIQQDNSQYITTLLLNWTFSAASTRQDNSQHKLLIELDVLRSKHSTGQLSTQASY